MIGLLSPERYDSEEVKALSGLPNRIIEASSTAHFQFVAYPTRVSSLEAVWRYAEVMHEGRLAPTFAELLGNGVTQEEMDLMRTIARAVVKLSAEHYQQTVVPKDALARALNVFRHIKYLYPNGDATIVEIGPGSGYLGALLLLSGFSYVGIDITQGFYLFQNHLFNAIAPGRVIELAADDRSVSEIAKVERGHALHIPWWKWMLTDPKFSFGADLVTANHCLCEMHPRALLYNVQAFSTVLSNGGAGGLVLFEGWGDTAMSQPWLVMKAFAERGYSLVEHSPFATVLIQSRDPAEGLQFPFARPTEAPPRQRRALDFLRPPPPPAVVRQPTMEDLYHPPVRTDRANPITDRILKGRARLMGENKLTMRDFEAALTEVANGASIASGDEVFLKYIGVAF